MGQQGAVWPSTAKDRERQRTVGGLLPAVEGHSLEWNRMELVQVMVLVFLFNAHNTHISNQHTRMKTYRLVYKLKHTG